MFSMGDRSGDHASQGKCRIPVYEEEWSYIFLLPDVSMGDRYGDCADQDNNRISCVSRKARERRVTCDLALSCCKGCSACLDDRAQPLDVGSNYS
ncbi:hypothetical protein TNCV_4861721 [Trichonephila clavipes]|nr:hypothetical protein TNCV_4861721 [Trichonephila clavipes]